MARNIHVELGKRSYDIAVGRDLPVGTTIGRAAGVKAMMVSDSNVDPLHGDMCERRLKAIGVETHRVVVPAGEQSKSREQVFLLYDKAAELQLERSSFIVALGGGVVGDLAGFAAATYLRGIRYIQVPTSLLAMVDSAVGGKTGINLRRGKNLVGAFHQPVEVVADLLTLATLPLREYVSGLAEVVKYGVIYDAGFFGLLEKSADRLLARDPSLLEDVVSRCCEIKALVVSADERESGHRAILNFGHTLGHAIERTSGYGTALHGEAVAIGMAYACALSADQRRMPREEAGRVSALLERLGLPVRPGGGLSWKTVRETMSSDKKTAGGSLRFVLVERLGSAIIGCEVSDRLLELAFTEFSCRT